MVKPDVVIVPDGVGGAAMVSTSGIEVGTSVCAVTSGGTWKQTQTIINISVRFVTCLKCLVLLAIIKKQV